MLTSDQNSYLTILILFKLTQFLNDFFIIEIIKIYQRRKLYDIKYHISAGSNTYSSSSLSSSRFMFLASEFDIYLHLDAK